MPYVIILTLTALAIYIVLYFDERSQIKRTGRMHMEYLSILDQKLLPLDFTKKTHLIRGSYQVTSYEKDKTVVSLGLKGSYTLIYKFKFISYYSRLTINNGKNSSRLDLNNIIFNKKNFLKTLEEGLINNQ